ncbi:hypothetical protein EZS27_010819 [termite gut metagenome]|uniref:Uncharacterized protein n=1 Tax=termite gut metagenome TaxID=433724 RepID=A0A5J4S7L5_9ZZZZ
MPVIQAKRGGSKEIYQMSPFITVAQEKLIMLQYASSRQRESSHGEC